MRAKSDPAAVSAGVMAQSSVGSREMIRKASRSGDPILRESR
jgi:hypothetical protein